MYKIECEFELYLSVIPVVSFNGQKYDVNVIGAELLSILIEEDPASEDESDAISFTIRRNSRMACFESARLRFMDITKLLEATMRDTSKRSMLVLSLPMG